MAKCRICKLDLSKAATMLGVDLSHATSAHVAAHRADIIVVLVGFMTGGKIDTKSFPDDVWKAIYDAQVIHSGILE